MLLKPKLNTKKEPPALQVALSIKLTTNSRHFSTNHVIAKNFGR